MDEKNEWFHFIIRDLHIMQRSISNHDRLKSGGAFLPEFVGFGPCSAFHDPNLMRHQGGATRECHCSQATKKEER